MNCQFMNKPFLLTIVSIYVLKQPQKPLFSGYNIGFYIEFFLLIIIWKRLKLLLIIFSTFCKEESETIQHVFVNCLYILPLWNKISMHILRNTGKRIDFHVHNILFGETSFSKDKKKLWILSFYIQNNTFVYVWNKKEYQLCVSLYIFSSLNTRLKNMPQSKN